jgi:hypothetical protein
VLVTPVPARGTTRDEFGALLTRVMLPEKLPAEAGANATLNEEDPPAGTESGKASPEEVKPVPERDA